MKSKENIKSAISILPSQIAEVEGHKACSQIEDTQRAALGQYFTPACVASFLAQMFKHIPNEIRLLDAGGGVGSLTAAFVERMVKHKNLPSRLELVVWEVDEKFYPGLTKVLKACTKLTSMAGISTTTKIIKGDFIEGAVNKLDRSPLFGLSKNTLFTHCILNPPYGKINTLSKERKLLRRAGLETTNLYTGFLWLAANLLQEDGEMVAITPRSFANGPYFLPFRKKFLKEMALKHLHTFERRNSLFSADQVLQENLIINAVRSKKRAGKVLLSSSVGDSGNKVVKRSVVYNRIIDTDDKSLTIHLSLNELDDFVANKIRSMPCTLEELRLSVSTGRVVDFRAKEFLRSNYENGTVPLIYPFHFRSGGVIWPKENAKKYNALKISPETKSLLIPNDNYVLVKRFTSKEEKRRVVAIFYQPIGSLKKFQTVGFENHLNYFHKIGGRLDDKLAQGLAIYLNSTLVDAYFRQFSGHTQVNATDLRKLRYPTIDQLRLLASKIERGTLDQSTIDSFLETTL